MELAQKDAFWYMLPICKAHNNKQYDRGGLVMTTTMDAMAVQMPIHPNYSLLNAADDNADDKPDSINKIMDKFMAKVLHKALPPLIKKVMPGVYTWA
jgi:hypothetical protein